ncbi:MULTISPECIES: LysR substrate-binding domain-containing protein [Lysobacter]|uniref:LysR substrate-binding domain-containing protein n=1 Tax=Lysobacter gummosus TaxID=262324 RepID=A0ABY3XHZ0_9GAMM|nr:MULTISPECIES: LysR substrate-binding domain-containing protein [Lysobacter]ALN90800.1 bacterial regulatory helix-turn-helix, lysR family protein [Lysobacter gummosus]UJB17464.1 LysR substrate-binding domain-containing protein [Lysobacter capsici]UJQ28813.1 LysR substrate-binding domain-containing protein [Lysobacter gummosus]UNP31261.1 LysR substrate-binding domain-containing protein [Lysobacter gummosus]
MIQSPVKLLKASRLKTRHLQLLLHLYEHRSVVRAADAADMTQPAASKLLSEMEHILGVPLFERHARGVEPTWYGQALIRRARSALSEIGRAHHEIEAMRSGRMGQAAIGTVVNPGTNLVPQAIAAVKRDFPDILIRVDMDYSRPLVAKLLGGQLDIVIGRILGPEGAGDLEFEPLADEPHSVIVRAGHPLTQRNEVTYADLLEYGWIMPPAASILRTRLDSMFLEHGLAPPQNIIETASLPLIIHLLRYGDLLTALPAESVAPYIQTAQMQVLPIDLRVRMEFFGIIRRRDQQLSPGAECVLQALRATARNLYPAL